VTTDETGAYLITNLPIGEYEVTIKMEGFQREVRQGIVLQVQQRALIDATLKVGTVVESIEVTTQAPLCSTLETQPRGMSSTINGSSSCR
jgi:hypothetical protein